MPHLKHPHKAVVSLPDVDELGCRHKGLRHGFRMLIQWKESQPFGGIRLAQHTRTVHGTAGG